MGPVAHLQMFRRRSVLERLVHDVHQNQVVCIWGTSLYHATVRLVLKKRLCLNQYKLSMLQAIKDAVKQEPKDLFID